jgi:hypothetical protein
MIAKEHIQVLDTLYKDGRISRQAMKSIRGQILSMRSFAEREAYLKKIIRRTAKRMPS